MSEKITKTSYSDADLQSFDEKLQSENLQRQQKLKENPPLCTKEVIGTGKKLPDQTGYRLKPSRPFWNKDKSDN